MEEIIVGIISRLVYASILATLLWSAARGIDHPIPWVVCLNIAACVWVAAVLVHEVKEGR